MGRNTAERRDELVHVNAINSFVYCPRRYHYLRYYDVEQTSAELIEGRLKHQRHSKRGGQIRELYLQSDTLGLHGKVDVIEASDDEDIYTPIERKRAASGEIYLNDRLQLAGYCMLLEERIETSVNLGYIYTRSTDIRHPVRITSKMRQAVRNIVENIRSMQVRDIPPFTQNPKKCESCSVEHYCLPEETGILEPDQVAGTGWEQ